MRLPRWGWDKEPASPWHKRRGFDPWVRKIPWRRAWQSTPVFLPGEFPWTKEAGGLQSTGSQRVSMTEATEHARTTLHRKCCILPSFYCIFHVVLSYLQFSWVQFSSVAQSCLTIYSHMDCSTPGLSVHHQIPWFTQTHVHRVSDAIQPSPPLSFPSPPASNLSQHQDLFQ